MGSEPDDPYPGDGICQTAAEFYSIATKSYNFWSVPSIESQEFDIERHLLSLLAGVPSFSFDSKQRLSWVDGDWLHLKCRSEWETTKASVCDVKVKASSTTRDWGFPRRSATSTMKGPGIRRFRWGWELHRIWHASYEHGAIFSHAAG